MPWCNRGVNFFYYKYVELSPHFPTVLKPVLTGASIQYSILLTWQGGHHDQSGGFRRARLIPCSPFMPVFILDFFAVGLDDICRSN